jgi:hypothetical protein
MKLINLTQNRSQWWALTNTVMNRPVPLKDREFLEKMSDY